MEVEGAVLLFNRSPRKNGLRYMTILSDGDSRWFHALQEADVYGFIKIQKEDCVNHAQKRMGTALSNLIARHKGGGSKTLGGRGRLTGDLITKFSSYYGWALKSRKGDVEAMQRAMIATYHHVTSNDIAEAVVKFNCGNLRTSSGILEELNLNPSLKSTRRMTKKDRH
ncbi:hypothetical protein HPB49_019527 [Dermacentor silvarum]|uniref:Uncharacterized protein n=1 Tax=Dermacentor silvarum TaxID=543639 RepID=A0ACB8CB00_DERSI|nr:hypothetical protein HPB49_019527 [Dermacentor silvarum]